MDITKCSNIKRIQSYQSKDLWTIANIPICRYKHNLTSRLQNPICYCHSSIHVSNFHQNPFLHPNPLAQESLSSSNHPFDPSPSLKRQTWIRYTDSDDGQLLHSLHVCCLSFYLLVVRLFSLSESYLAIH